MSLWKIAWRSIQQRGLASALTTFSMALGVMLVVAVLSILGVVSESFKNSADTGYNILVGAKGGKLQLTLNTVYYLSEPIENIPYDYYLEFVPGQQRAAELQHSLYYDPENETDRQRKERTRNGKYSQYTELAIPVCLGDYFGRFRVVGTTPDMFAKLPSKENPYKFAAGRNFQRKSQQHGYFEAVVGAAVAREKKVRLGDEISPAHGDPEGAGHAQTFTVVGILAPTGTPNDRAAFINIEGFYLMEDHAKPIETDDETDGESSPADGTDATAHDAGDHSHDHAEDERRPLPIEQREVTAVLVRTSHFIFAIGVPNMINEENVAQAVMPVEEIYNLLEIFVMPFQWVLLILTAMICVVSGISILVSIYNSMSERRHEIAVMRAMGAGRGTVMTIILLESIFLSLGGGALGWMSGHAINAVASSSVEARTGVAIGFFDFTPSIVLAGGRVLPYPEFFLIPALILLAVVVGFLPALSAYRTDVAKSLGS